MMEAVRERGAWRGRREVFLKDLKPRQARHLQEEDSIWFYLIVTQFRNPCDGQLAIYVDLKDITKEVRQEEKIRGLQRQEQALLKEMMPEHVIQHLVQEKANSMFNLIRQGSVKRPLVCWEPTGHDCGS